MRNFENISQNEETGNSDRQKQRVTKMLSMLFLCYLFLLVRIIIFKYPLQEMREIVNSWSKEVVWEGIHTANFTFFKTITMYIRYAGRLNSFENLVGNVVAFIPFGFLFPLTFRHGKNFFVMFFHAFVFVLGIELFQLFSAFGAFDVDDILLNCLGAVIGWVLYLTLFSSRKAAKEEGMNDGHFTLNRNRENRKKRETEEENSA